MSKKRKKRNGSSVSGSNSSAVNTAQKSEVVTVSPFDRAYFSAPRLRSFAVNSSRKADVSSSGILMARRGSEEDEDAFSRYYGPQGNLVEPPFPFEWLWSLYQECDTLNLCCQAMVDNCENHIDFVWEGEKGDDDTDEAKAHRILLRDFFSRVNEKDSFLDLRKKIRLEREVTGNAFVEVMRDKNLEKDPITLQWKLTPKPDRLYYIPSTHMRVTYLQSEEIPVEIKLPRAGKLIPVDIKKKFRKFARKNPHTNEITWFREFGDPRIMDAKTGEYVGATDNPATEIWWFRDNYAGAVYGLPKWLSVVWDISGRYQAKWINFDHLDQGAIPPGFFATEGGTLTKASKEMLDKILEEIRDPKYFNRFIHLEITPDLNMDFNASGAKSTPKLKFIKLRDPQHEDLMNEKFLKTTKEDIREVFRIPPVLAGIAGNDTFASAYVSMEVAESQVFEPQKEAFDSKITTELIQNEFGIYLWRVKTRQSKIGDKETFYKAVGALTRAGLLTINDGRELANQLLGTSLPPFTESEVYKEPMGLVNRLVDAGLVVFDESTRALQFTEPMTEIAATIANTVKSGKSQKSFKALNGQKSTEALAQQLVKALIEIENRIEKGEYQAPDIDEQDCIL